MLDEARAAASYIGINSSAYGHFVGALIADHYINPHGDEAISAFAKAVDGLNGLADQVRGMADDFERSDNDAAVRLRGRDSTSHSARWPTRWPRPRWSPARDHNAFCSHYARGRRRSLIVSRRMK